MYIAYIVFTVKGNVVHVNARKTSKHGGGTSPLLIQHLLVGGQLHAPASLPTGNNPGTH